MKTLNTWICGISATFLILIAMGSLDQVDEAAEAQQQVATRAVQWSDLDQAAEGLGDFDRTAKK